MARSSILRLFFGRCPSAITEFVVPVAIAPVQSCTMWSFTHVGKEVFKDKPAFADRDPTSSPIFPAAMIGIQASLNHMIPTPIGRTCRAVRGVSMFGMRFFRQTAAALRQAFQQMGRSNQFCCSTIAITKPHQHPNATWSQYGYRSNSRPATESLPLEFMFARSASGIRWIGHQVISLVSLRQAVPTVLPLTILHPKGG